MNDLLAQFGSAKHPDRPVAKQRPEGTDDATVEAVGKLSEALEVVEACRGHLYQFHRLTGTADLALQEAVTKLRDCGQDKIAEMVDQVLVGRDVIDGRWTFQLIEAYDSGYWSVFRAVEEAVRNALVGGETHVYEAEMKYAEQQPRD